MSHQPEASRSDTKTRAIFVLAAKKPPYCVYGNPFYDHAGYGNIFSVDSEGSLKDNVQNYEYCPQTAIHGMVFDPKEEYLYSADMWANRIWCHKKDAQTGKLETVGSIDAPRKGDHPRWVEMHPSGKYLYALMEAGNTLAAYTIDEKTRMPVPTGKMYPLIPPSERYRTLVSHRTCADWMQASTTKKTRTCTERTSSSFRHRLNFSLPLLARTRSISQATSLSFL